MHTIARQSRAPCAWPGKTVPQPHVCHASRLMQQSVVPGTAALLLLVSGLQAEELSIPVCKPKTACVSTSSYRSPSQYLAPWLHQEHDPQTAQKKLELELQSMGATIVDSGLPFHVHAQVPYKLAGIDEIDEVMFDIRDGIVLFRSLGTGIKGPDPAFCWTPGCVSGPRQRMRMDELRNRLGWLSMETDEDKKWVQIMLH